MKTKTIIMKKSIFIIFLLINTSLFANDFDLLISTYNHKNAIIKVKTSAFKNNQFTVSLCIKWVNHKLKKRKNKKTVLAVDYTNLNVYPNFSVNVEKGLKHSSFENDTINIIFQANPNFEGGNIRLTLPIIYAENKEQAQMGNWREVLYSQEKKLIIEKHIDFSEIKDIYGPAVKLKSPLPKDEEDYPICNKRKVKIEVSATDRNQVKSLKINGKTAEYKFPDIYFTDITLFTGENIIKVESTDSLNNTSVTRFKLISTYQYDIDLKGGDYYALLIAEEKYEDEYITNLDKPVKDASSLHKTLVDNYTFAEDNVYFMKNPTMSEIIKQLEFLADVLTENDNLLVFYAGHGYWDEQKEIGYWLPSDANISDYSTWLRNSTVKDYIGAIKTKHTLLVTDACFSGSIFKSRGLKGGKVVAYQKIYNMTSRKGMTSGTLKEVPDESVFLKTLIKRLNQNQDKYLTSSNLFVSLRDAVLNNSPNVPQYGTIQGVGDEGGEFIFIKR